GGLAAEGEDIEVLELAIDQAMTMIGEGRIVDAKTIMLLQYAALNIFLRCSVKEDVRTSFPARPRMRPAQACEAWAFSQRPVLRLHSPPASSAGSIADRHWPRD